MEDVNLGFDTNGMLNIFFKLNETSVLNFLFF